ncbi:hypothetical protein P3T76_001837 [Phytophthora citrophthora]|uniref:Transposase putative helix-turn-helix domain-containing protein n=1 Tax=Phytophthora citrophthora TaxID=4793 RepID=A0AAD9LTK8_9STRA|nr:hypothetical protein P3T76_001837 [Phytophthora citrophthora]
MNCLEPKPWFAFLKQRNTDQQTQSLLALEHFDNTARWPCDREKHESKRVTFESKPQRAAEISGYTATINVLKCNATDHADDIEAASAIRGELKAQDKLLTTRMRKYQLFPTTKQSQQLIRYMGTCRWTYNQAVAHFRATNVSKAATLRDLYVTQVSNKQRVYPEGMEPPPQWVYETPKSFRFNALRKFESSVKSAFSNPSTGNIKKFKVRFKSRKTDGRYFTFYEDASLATIQHRRGQRALLSISKLKGIQIRCDLGLVITNEIQITNTNGFWYAVIPQAYCTKEYSYHDRVIALDPGVKAFMTGVDLNGNVLHVDRGTREHLDGYRSRIIDAQIEMALIKKHQGTSVRAAVASVHESQACIPLRYGKTEKRREGDALPDGSLPDEDVRRYHPPCVQFKGYGEEKYCSEPHLQPVAAGPQAFPIPADSEGQVRVDGENPCHLLGDVHESDMWAVL